MLEKRPKTKEKPSLRTAARAAEKINDESDRNLYFFSIGKNALDSGDFDLARELFKKITKKDQGLRINLGVELAIKSKDPKDVELVSLLKKENDPLIVSGIKPKENDGIPIMITRDMEGQLMKLGLSTEEINKLTPKEAWGIINKEKTEVQKTKWVPSPESEEKEKNGPAAEVPETSEEIRVQKEIEQLSPEDREKIGWGLSTIGFKVEKIKNEFFASALEKPLSKINKDGTVGRFLNELRTSFVRDAEKATKKANGKGIVLKQLSDKVTLAGNVIKYGRMLTDLTGTSLASPLRYVMLGGMATTRLAEAGKEARFKNKEVIEKTRIVEIEKAKEEAWKIYNNARKKENVGEDENVSVKSIKRAYLMEMPKDLLERISRSPEAANGLIQKIIRGDLMLSINILNKKITKIEKNAKLTPEQKEAEIEKLLAKQKQNLEDYDRTITQYGTVDELAMAARYAQTTGKAVVAGVQIETIFLSVQKLSETISGLFHHDHATLATIHSPHARQIHLSASHPIPPPPDGMTTTPENAPIDPHSIAVVHKGEGIENAFRRQIEHNGELAKALGFKGDIHNADELHKFSGGAAHRLAIEKGYVSVDGQQQIGVTQADKVAYEAKLENGKIVVEEKDLTGKTFLKIEDKGIFGETKANPYDKEFNTSHHETITENIQHNNQGSTGIAEETDKHLNKIETPAHQEMGTQATQDEIIKKMEAGDKSLPNEKISTESGTPSKDLTHEEIIRKDLLEKMERGDPSLPNERISAENAQSLPEHSLEERVATLSSNPYFAQNPYNLSNEKILEAYETSEKNIKLLLGSNSSDIWKNIKGIPAQLAMEKTWENNPNLYNATIKTGKYLRLLERFSNLKPRRMFLGIVPETTNSYVSFAIQKITLEGRLEEFEQSLKNIIK